MLQCYVFKSYKLKKIREKLKVLRKSVTMLRFRFKSVTAKKPLIRGFSRVFSSNVTLLHFLLLTLYRRKIEYIKVLNYEKKRNNVTETFRKEKACGFLSH